jgi:uncharacterized protein YbaR (Trm112 family)
MSASWCVGRAEVGVDVELLEIIACPDTHHAPLSYDADAQTLTCTECGRIFPIRDGIPVLLLDEATQPTDRPASGASPNGSAPPQEGTG